MTSADDILFGKIAVSSGFCDVTDIAQCLHEQETLGIPIPLGELLVRKGYLTSAQVEEVLHLQKQRLEMRDVDTQKQKRDLLFGQLILERGWATGDQIKEALREQGILEERGEIRQLGRLLVERGIVTAEQIQQLLREQNKLILRCLTCGARYNVAGYDPGKLFRCLKCNEPLVVPKKLDSIGVDASIRSDGTSASLIGRILGGCKILKEIGRGGMATVYQGHHVGLDKEMAIKVLPPTSAHNRGFIERFVAEAQAAAKLEHPNIVQVFNVGCEGDLNFILMQLVDGRSLTQLIRERNRIPPTHAVRIVKEIARGLGAAHRAGIVHRDVKPDNVLISGGGQVKVADFGLARDLSRAPAHTPTAIEKEGTARTETVEPIMGTPYFMSPEQWAGKPVDGRSDLYSLGATFYYMIVGRPPFEGKTLAVLREKHTTVSPLLPHLAVEQLSAKSGDREEVPEGVSAVIQKLLHKDPAKRYASAEALVRDLDRILQDQVPEALAEMGQVMVCTFCGAGNPHKTRRCLVCGEFLHEKKEAAILLDDEFECPKCHHVQAIGPGRCEGCRVLLCTRCHRRPAVAHTTCNVCAGTIRRVKPPGSTPRKPKKS